MGAGPEVERRNRLVTGDRPREVAWGFARRLLSGFEFVEAGGDQSA
jgi:hypothetical protein